VGHCSLYYMLTYNHLNCIEAPLFLLDNASVSGMVNDHILNHLNRYYRDTVIVLFKCSRVCIPQKKQGFLKINTGDIVS